MAETLYRKYRPQTFADVVNQQHVRITIQNALVQNRTAHAYLFAGPRGIGKTTLARILARAINCQKRKADGEPCNACQTCQAMSEGRLLDLVEIDAASQTGVDNVRENVIQSARSVPSLGKYKVFIIDEVHMLSLAAFNALLKLLEEPPAHALFILATTDVHRVPATIISRTQRFDFKRLSISDMAGRLRDLARQEKRKLEDGVAERIARFAGGSMRDAESMLGQLFSFQDEVITRDIADLVLPRSNEDVVIRLTAALVNQQATVSLDIFHQYCDEGGDIPVLVHDLALMSRALLLASVDPRMIEHVMPGQDAANLKELMAIVSQGSTPKFLQMVDELLQAERQLYRGAMLELPVEVAIVKIAGTDDSPPPALPPAPASHQKSEMPKPTEAKPTRPTKSNTGKLSLEAAQRAWLQVRSDLNGGNPSLKISLQQAEVVSVEGDEIHVGVPFALHQKRLQDPQTQAGLVEKLRALLEAAVKLHFVVQSTNRAQPEPAKPMPVPAPKPATGKGDLWEQVVASFEG